MKTILAIGLTALSVFALVVVWRGHPWSAMSGSASQIFIHGTPVCVFRHGESIVARVGECGAGSGSRDAAPAERFPEFDRPETGLPPGHPPVGPDSLPGGGARRIPI